MNKIFWNTVRNLSFFFCVQTRGIQSFWNIWREFRGAHLVNFFRPESFDIFRTLHVLERDPFEGHRFSVNNWRLNILHPRPGHVSIYRGLRTLHCMDSPSMARKLKANFSGVIALDFSTDVAANSFWESRNKKIYLDLVSRSNENK